MKLVGIRGDDCGFILLLDCTRENVFLSLSENNRKRSVPVNKEKEFILKSINSFSL